MKSMQKALLSLLIIALASNFVAAQMTKRPELAAKKVAKSIKIDGILNEPAWLEASFIDKFTEFRPTPFKVEAQETRTETYIMYSNEGIYVGGKCFERNQDSISKELIGRDGFGNNDFFGIIFDTYNDKINGFEYFVTPLGEQMDAKASADGEDLSWNAVWESASVLEKDGWRFEVFIPFSAIRFGKSDVQNWGLNFTRRRVKTGQQFTWATVDPQINGFLTQEGFWTGLKDIKPPIRLQFSPYASYYSTFFSKVKEGEKKVVSQFNGGMDVKYGINQAFTLDMTLIPDFGQVQTDNRVLNLTPFEQRFSEQRPFFTEGLELFNKGGLFYSRRIGKNPYQASYDYTDVKAGEILTKDPQETQVLNATKVSGRMQNGLAIGVLNAITGQQNATIFNQLTKNERKVSNYPLTNYNMIVVDKTLKNNSSVSFVNTNVLRNGSQYDANVSKGLFEFNDKKNTWNFGGSVGLSSLLGAEKDKSNTNGYIQEFHFGKISGAFNFRVWHELADAKYNQNDMGYATNSNYNQNGFFAGYRWNKPKYWYNNLGWNINGYSNYLVKSIDPLKQGNHRFQEMFIATNFYGQTKKLWQFYGNFNNRVTENDYYEARTTGRVFKRASRQSLYVNLGSNDAKKYSFSLGGGFQTSQQFANSYNINPEFYHKLRFNQRFSIDHSLTFQFAHDQAGFGKRVTTTGVADSVFFSRRDRKTIENSVNLKYNFTNKMGLNFNVRHYWSGVSAKELFLLNTQGYLDASKRLDPATLNQNYNAFALNMVYTWQIANGSFINIVWKDEADDFLSASFKDNYRENLDRTFNSNHTNSLSFRIIYFVDYLSLKRKKA
jgi:hypothetical protein